MAEMSCEVCQSLIPEIALGVLHGRERAEALAHIEHCPACQRELLLMGDLADRLVELTPSAEPPAGFETRVLAALAASTPEGVPADRLDPNPASIDTPGDVTDPAATSNPWAWEPPVTNAPSTNPASTNAATSSAATPATPTISGSASANAARGPGSVRGMRTARSGSGRARRGLRPAAFALAAAALAAVVAVSSWTIGHHDASHGRPSVAAGHATVASLVADKRTIGQVVVTRGGEPWVAMAMNTTFGDQRVTCELREQNGTSVRLGSFKLKNGYGYWAAPIPLTTSPIVGAQLVGAHGATLATARVSVSDFGH
jgi:hypothetical protein